MKELSAMNARLAVHAEKFESMHETLREVLHEAKRTNGRLYTNEAAVAEVRKDTDTHAQQLHALRETETKLRSAGWKVAAALVAASGAVSGFVAAVANALTK